MQKILHNEMLAEMNRANRVFSIGFRKDNGDFSVKENVMNRSSNLSNRKKMNRSGLVRCMQKNNDLIFDATIDLIVRFDGMEVIRPEKND